jgi:hypothetical protein
MTEIGTEADAQAPTPDPALRRLDPLVGEWDMKGNLVGSSEENITGRAAFRWLEGDQRLCLARVLEPVTRAARLPVGPARQQDAHHGLPRPTRRDLRGHDHRRRPHLLGWMAAEPRRRRDHQRALRRTRFPRLPLKTFGPPAEHCAAHRPRPSSWPRPVPETPPRVVAAVGCAAR